MYFFIKDHKIGALYLKNFLDIKFDTVGQLPTEI